MAKKSKIKPAKKKKKAAKAPANRDFAQSAHDVFRKSLGL